MTVGYAHQILAIDYHLSYYRTACHHLTEGIADPKEFARVETIKDASLCAIALEAGIITEIGSGKLDRPDWEKAIAFIHRYEQDEVIEDESCSSCKSEDLHTFHDPFLPIVHMTCNVCGANWQEATTSSAEQDRQKTN